MVSLRSHEARQSLARGRERVAFGATVAGYRTLCVVYPNTQYGISRAKL
jgi:hypothetical protein